MALPGKFSGNLRRRFHHLMLAKRKEGVLGTRFPRPKRILRPISSSKLIVLRRLFGFVLALGLLVGLSYTIFFSDFFTITKVSLEKPGNAVAASSLSPFLDKLKGKNIIFLNSGTLTRELEQTFKNEILLVRVKKSYPHRLILQVTEYPAALNLTVITPEKNQKFILNQIGYAIFENEVAPFGRVNEVASLRFGLEHKNIPTLVLRSAKPLTGKSVIIPKEKMDVFVSIFQKFHDFFGIKIIEGEWKKIERELHLKTEKNFLVWLDLTGNAETQLEKLKRVLPKLDIYREPLEYIDLRIAGAESEKVIFKRRK